MGLPGQSHTDLQPADKIGIPDPAIGWNLLSRLPDPQTTLLRVATRCRHTMYPRAEKYGRHR